MPSAYNAAYYQIHKEALKERARVYALANPLKIREGWLKRQYGITSKQYDAMLVAQDGRCAICPATKPGRRDKFFHVDHNHVTGKARGLLCSNCNTALGLLQDSVVLLASAAEYLNRHDALEVANG